jgi:LysM repeat protein
VNQLGDGCSLISDLYYCVQINYATQTPTWTASTTTTTSTSAITTPTPTQTGMVSTCNDFYLVVSGDSCYDIATANAIALDDLYSWNPAVGTNCAGLWPDYYICVGVAGGSSATTTTIKTTITTTTTTTSKTTTTTGNGVATPTPTQANMASNCNAFYLVVSGDSCYDIAVANGIALADLYSWNPAVGTGCGGLWPDYYICVGLIGGSTPTTTTTTTTTKTGNGVTTPTPIQTGMVTTCKTFYLVVSGDGCYDIAAAAGVTLANFYAWNPAVGTNCASLWPDYYVCIGV